MGCLPAFRALGLLRFRWFRLGRKSKKVYHEAAADAEEYAFSISSDEEEEEEDLDYISGDEDHFIEDMQRIPKRKTINIKKNQEKEMYTFY